MAQKVEVVLQPLYAPEAGRAGAVCSILKIDDATFMLDCGWDERMGSEALEPLKKVCETVDAVLISHGDVEHCGALPFLVAQCGLRAPVFVTVPVHRLAQLLLYDLVSAKGRAYAADDLPVTLDQVDASLRLAAFGGSCRALRFREEVTVKGVTIMAEAAGRTLGGAAWSLSRLTERIVYAHGVGTHRGLAIPSCAFIPSSSAAAAAPARDVTLLVTECAASEAEPRALTEPPVAVKASEVTAQLAAVASAVEAGGSGRVGPDSHNSSSSSSSASSTLAGVEALAGAIAETWRQQGNVLVPVDSGARLLEVLVGLEQSPALAAAPMGIVAVLSPVAPALMGHAAAFRDWSLAKPGVNPFALQRVRIAATVQELGRLPPPLCVLTPCPGMDEGFSRQLLPMWAADVRNTVIITSPPHPASLAARLLRGETQRRAVAAAAGDRAAGTAADRVIARFLGASPRLSSGGKVGSTTTSSSSSSSSSSSGDASGARTPSQRAISAPGNPTDVGAESFAVPYLAAHTRKLEGEELEQWERRRVLERAAKDRDEAAAARRRIATERARAAEDAATRAAKAAEDDTTSAATGSQSSSSGQAAVNLSSSSSSSAAAAGAASNGPASVDPVVLARAAAARARLGLPPLAPAALARGVAGATSALPDGAGALAPPPVQARFGGLLPLQRWSDLGAEMDMTALQPAATAFSVTATTVKCRVGFIDLSARVAAGGIAAIAAALGPRAVAVLGGQSAGANEATPDAIATTASMIRAALGTASSVVVASSGESLPLGSGAGMRSVRIAPALFTSLQFKEIGGCEVSLVRGYSAGAAGAQAMGDEQRGADDQAVDIDTATATKLLRVLPDRSSRGGMTVLGAVWEPAMSGAGQAAADVEEDEDEAAMVAAAGGAAASLLNVPLDAREPLILHAGPLPLRALFRAVARGGGAKPSLKPGVVRAGGATVAMPGQGRLLLSGTPGADFDRVKAAVRGLTGTV